MYRAKDTKLGREVAVKLLLDEVSTDPERLARFEREARVLASLNHKNIASLHAFEREGDTGFLVMELVEGETLADRIAHGPIPVDEAIPLFLQIAEGLEAAHEKGVIHRDLKPANIKIGNDGGVKILDFGLAKAMAVEASGSGDGDLSESPTLTLAATQRGQILGTAAYMAPEQARGKTVDKRADVWAFGVCLFEALSGKRVFQGEDASITLAAVLKSEPDWDRLADATPRLSELLARCLRKDPKQRLRDIGDARLEIDELIARPQGPLPETTGAVRRKGVAVAGVIAAAVVGALLGRWIWPGPGTPSGSERARSVSGHFSINLPPEAPLAVERGYPLGFDMRTLALSRDGSRLAYTGWNGETTQLFVARIGEPGADPVPGTEGAYSPFFSPDGLRLGYLTPASVMKVSLQGGSPEFVCSAVSPFGATWYGESIFFSGELGHRIKKVPATGGTPELLIDINIAEDVPRLINPVMLPGGQSLLLTGWGFATNQDYADILVLSLADGTLRTIVERAGYSASYVSSGHLVYARAGGLRAFPFDVERLEVTGESTPVLDGVVMASLFGIAQYSVSENGLLAYLPGGDVARGSPTWVDQDGTIESLEMPVNSYSNFKLSPDGRQLAIQVAEVNDHVVIFDTRTGSSRQLTLEGNNGWPIWLQDGRAIAFSSDRQGPLGLYTKLVDGSSGVELLLTNEQASWLTPAAWSSETQLLAVSTGDGAGFETTIYRLNPGQSLEPVAFPGGAEFSRWGEQFSPDGQWVAYSARPEGHFEIYVRRYPDFDREWKASSGTNSLEPMWSPDGSEIFYRDGTQWMAVSMTDTVPPTFTQPRRLFDVRFTDTAGVSWDMAPDGRFLVIQPVLPKPSPTQVNVVLNWFEELERLVSTD